MLTIRHQRSGLTEMNEEACISCHSAVVGLNTPLTIDQSGKPVRGGSNLNFKLYIKLQLHSERRQHETKNKEIPHCKER